MPDALIQYGVVVLFVWAFAVQAGMPLPSRPDTGRSRRSIRLRPDEPCPGYRCGDGRHPRRRRALVFTGSVPGDPSARDREPFLPRPGLLDPGGEGAVRCASRAVSDTGQVSARREPARGRTRRRGAHPPAPRDRLVTHIRLYTALGGGWSLPDAPWTDQETH